MAMGRVLERLALHQKWEMLLLLQVRLQLLRAELPRKIQRFQKGKKAGEVFLKEEAEGGRKEGRLGEEVEGI